jgi:hypothetical protein
LHLEGTPTNPEYYEIADHEVVNKFIDRTGSCRDIKRYALTSFWYGLKVIPGLHANREAD